MPKSKRTRKIILSEEFLNQQKITKKFQNDLNSFLQERSFADLSHKEKIKYCKLIKVIGEAHWSCFKLAKAEKAYTHAAEHFDKAFELSFEKARDLFDKIDSTAHESTEPVANKSYIRGLKSHLNLGISKRQNYAVECYKWAVTNNESLAIYKLALCYLSGIGCMKNYEETIRLLELAIGKGDAGALNTLGYCFQYGCGVQKDLSQAVDYREKAALQGHPRALSYAGEALITSDPVKAMRYLRYGAEQGGWFVLKFLKSNKNPFAQYTLAMVNREYSTAIKLALSNDTIFPLFLEADLEEIMEQLGGLAFLRDFINTVHENVKGTSDSAMIDLLLHIDRIARQNISSFNDQVASLQTQLISMIKPMLADEKQVKPLMLYFAHVYFDNKSAEVIPHLFTLWHKAQLFKLSFESYEVKILSSIFVHHVYGYSYVTKFDAILTMKHLSILMFMAETMPEMSVDELNTLLKDRLIVPYDCEETPQKLLPRLKKCLSNPAIWNGQIPPYISQMSQCITDFEKDNPSVDTAQLLLMKLINRARLILDKKNKFFSVSEEEKKLARLLTKYDSHELLIWIKEHESVENLIAIIPACNKNIKSS